MLGQARRSPCVEFAGVTRSTPAAKISYHPSARWAVSANAVCRPFLEPLFGARSPPIIDTGTHPTSGGDGRAARSDFASGGMLVAVSASSWALVSPGHSSRILVGLDLLGALYTLDWHTGSAKGPEATSSGVAIRAAFVARF